MAQLIFAARVYLDSSPAFANQADIGLYAVAGGNSEIRVIEADISAYGPTLTWKTGVLVPEGIADIEEEVDTTEGGRLPVIGGSMVETANTLSFGGVFTQLDRILDDNDIRLTGLRCDIVEFEIAAGALVNAGGTVRYRGIYETPSWTEAWLRVAAHNALLKRRTNLGTLITPENYPDADGDALGETVPISFGEFRPEFDIYDNPLWNGYAKFIRVANKQSYWNADELNGVNNPSGIGIFPVVWPVASVAPTLRYRVRIAETYAGPAFPDLEGYYLFVIEGQGDGYRRIKKATVVGNALLEIVLDDYFTDTLQGNATAEATDQSWVRIVNVARAYEADVWPCKDFINPEGEIVSEGLALYAYQSEQTVDTEASAGTYGVAERSIGFHRLPSYAYELYIDGDKNRIVIDVKLFEGNLDRVNSYLILPVKNVALSTEPDTSDWNLTLANKQPGFDGLYAGDTLLANSLTLDAGSFADVVDGDSTTRIRFTIVRAAGNGVIVLLEFELPDYPRRLSYDNAYFGLRMAVDNADAVTTTGMQWRRFVGAAHIVSNHGANASGGQIHLFQNLPDFYFKDAPDTHNEYLYVESTSVVRSVFLRVTSGRDQWLVTGIQTEPLYKSLHRGALWFSLASGVGSTAKFSLYELAMIFRKAVSIREAVYSPFRGRIYAAPWGSAQGSSSWSSSSSSCSSPSSSSSSSSSSQSSPSPSSSSSVSSSSSSQSSPSSSSSSSPSCIHGIGRKDGCAMIDNPIDIIEHILRLQNWSEQGQTKDWGHEYADDPLIDVSTNEGGFDYEDLNSVRDYRPAWQILDYGRAWSDTMIESLCREYFLVQYQNPATSEECISSFVNKSLTPPATTITLSDIIGEIQAVKLPEARGIYCEPVMRYCRHNATRRYDKIIRITNVSQAVYDPSYVVGLTGTTAELMWTRGHVLWQAYRQIEEPPADMTDCPSIVNDTDAIKRLDTWFSWMGALNTDGTPGGVVFEPKKRIAFAIPYETGRDWFLTQHHMLQLPHQTNDQALEFMIERYRKGITKRGEEMVALRVVLYGAVTEIEMYIQDTWVPGVELADWQDHLQTQVQRGEGGADIQDIT